MSSRESGTSLMARRFCVDASVMPKQRGRLPLPISRPEQQVTAVCQAREFLVRLINTRQTPGIPREVRREARALLRHYPPAVQLRAMLEGSVERADGLTDLP